MDMEWGNPVLSLSKRRRSGGRLERGLEETDDAQNAKARHIDVCTRVTRESCFESGLDFGARRCRSSML
jgi:hypothetical protein